MGEWVCGQSPPEGGMGVLRKELLVTLTIIDQPPGKQS